METAAWQRSFHQSESSHPPLSQVQAERIQFHFTLTGEDTIDECISKISIDEIWSNRQFESGLDTEFPHLVESPRTHRQWQQPSPDTQAKRPYQPSKQHEHVYAKMNSLSSLAHHRITVTGQWYHHSAPHLRRYHRFETKKMP